jgi:hypothetical protein
VDLTGGSNPRFSKKKSIVFDAVFTHNSQRLETEWTDEACPKMNNRHGNTTPLHWACGTPTINTSIAKMRRLIDDNPEALSQANNSGKTPLHLACKHFGESPDILNLLLSRCPRQVLGMIDNAGCNPLHYACIHGLSLDSIRQMIRLYPKALRMTTKYRTTSLHLVCGYQSRSSLELIRLIRLLASHCQVLCLVHDGNRRSPYECLLEYRKRGEDGRELLLEITIDTAIAFLLLVYVNNYRSMITVPPSVLAHIRRVIPEFSSQGFSMSYMSRNEAIRQRLNDLETLNALLNNSDLQKMLKNEDYHDLIDIMCRLVKAGSTCTCTRLKNDTVQPETKDHISILESVSGTPDCIYLHLRSNPILCCRSTRRSVASTQQQESTTVVQSATASMSEETRTVVNTGRKRKSSDRGR